MPQPPVTRDRILDTAEALFAERGFAGTVVRDIAAAIGLTPASLYNHFAGKEAIYAAVLERGIRPLIEVLEDMSTREPERDALDAALGRVMEHLARRPNVARLLYHEALTGAAHLVPLARAWIQPVLARALGEMKRELGSPWAEEEHPPRRRDVGASHRRPLCRRAARLRAARRGSARTRTIERQTRFLLASSPSS